MICVIDNYDSFVYNLVQYVGALGDECVVYRNDEVTVEQVAGLAPDLILISPGPPGDPADAGVSIELIRRLGSSFPPFFSECVSATRRSVRPSALGSGTPPHRCTGSARRSATTEAACLPGCRTR